MNKSNLKVKDVVEQAICVLLNNKWQKGFAASDSCGRIVLPQNKAAVSFCAFGALSSVDQKVGYDAYLEINEYLKNHVDFAGKKLFEVNDSCSSKEEIINILRNFLTYTYGK